MSLDETGNNDDAEPAEYTHYSSRKPIVEDSKLISILENNGVEIQAEAETGNWWVYALIFMAPWLLLIGYSIYAGKKMQG